MKTVSFAFAGDRDIAVSVLRWLLQRGERPVALLLPDESASHADALIDMCDFLPDDAIIRGRQFQEAPVIQMLRGANIDILVCVHYPYIVPPEVLKIPTLGAINLHPALLPYCRGWHTPTWAILDQVPYGATVHFMDEGLDTGDIIHQKELYVLESDTAHSLYERVKSVEFEVFTEAWDAIKAGKYSRRPQLATEGTKHSRRDLFSETVQRIDLDSWVCARDLFRQLRALTTNNVEEAAFFVADGRKYRVQVTIVEQQ